MITIWRLTTKTSAVEAFDGEGARKHGGRWNSKGTPCVYSSISCSLALLENLVHFDLDTAPPLYLYSVELQETAILPTPTLPGGWEDEEQATQVIGHQWIQSKRSLALEIPSAIVPMEKNYLLNPLHSTFASIKVVQHGQFDVDKRLFR